MEDRHAKRKKYGIVLVAVVFVLLMIVPAMLAVVCYRTYTSLTNQEIAKEQTLSDLAALALKIKLDHLVSIASSLAATQQVVSSAKDGQWTDAVNAARDLENDVNFYDPFIDRIIVFDPNGTQQAAYPALTGGLGTSASSSAWYMALSSGGQASFVTGVAKRASLPQIEVVNVAVPILSGQTPVGFLVLQIPTDNFLEFVGDLNLGTYGFGYIVDTKGNIIAHPRIFSDGGTVVNYSVIPEVQDVMAGDAGTDIVSSQGTAEKSIVTYKPVDDYGWGVITQELYSEAFSTRSTIISGLENLILSLVLIILLITYLLVRIWINDKNDKA